MISDLFSVTVLVGILASGIRLATPYLYAAIGETFGQRSGVLNLGVEGQMLLGAFAAFYVALTTGNLGLAVLVAMIVGALMGSGNGLCDCQFTCPAGDQRYWFLPVRSRDERLALPENAGYCGNCQRVSENLHPVC